MSLQNIARISREYGSNERYVLAGGGNTSFKDADSLYVKASGFALSTIEEDGFVRMERQKLAQIWDKKYPDSQAEREAMALADLMAARAPGEADKRPSVETLLHEAIPEAYVVHTHPSLVNGITCSTGGAAAAREIFGKDALWIPIVNAGYILATTVRDALQDYVNAESKQPEYILLQNHGVFISSDTIEGIKSKYDALFTAIESRLARQPDTSEEAVDQEAVAEVTKILENAAGEGQGKEKPWIQFSANTELLRIAATPDSFTPVSSAFTPDQIVYCGHKPLYVGPGVPAEAIPGLISKHAKQESGLPKIVAVSGLGIFGIGSTGKAALNAVVLFGDTAKISVYAESFGGHQFMPQDQIDFIRGWEVEHYRAKLSEK